MASLISTNTLWLKGLNVSRGKCCILTNILIYVITVRISKSETLREAKYM